MYNRKFGEFPISTCTKNREYTGTQDIIQKEGLNMNHWVSHKEKVKKYTSIGNNKYSTNKKENTQYL